MTPEGAGRRNLEAPSRPPVRVDPATGRSAKRGDAGRSWATGWSVQDPAGSAGFLLAAGAGVFAGVSPLLGGAYSIRVWGWVGLAALACLPALLVGATRLPARRAMLCVAGLALVAAWSALSASWSESVDQAMTEAGRWSAYAAVLACLVFMLAREPRLAWVMLGGLAVGVTCVAVGIAVEMAAGRSALFLGGRLNEPLGYVNGQAGHLALGFWPLVAVAERSRGAALRGLGAAGATLVLCLLVATQSRGVAIALCASGVLVLAAVPGRRTRVWALAVVGIGAGAVSGALLDVDSGEDAVRRAGALALVVAGVVGLVWSAAVAATAAASRRDRNVAAGLSRLSLAGVGAIAVIAASAAAIATPSLIERGDRELSAFTRLEQTSAGGGRFLSGGGNRYDYWRVAAEEFAEQPLIGAGAGNYDIGYFLRRRTSEDIRQPHSIELQVLAEVGAIGFLPLALVLGLGLAGAARGGRWGRDSEPLDPSLAVAAGGTFVVWLVHTSVDWLHLLPGVTMGALAALAVLVVPWRGASEIAWPPRRRLVLVGAATLAVALATVLISRQLIGETLRARAQDELVRDPGATIDDAGLALAVNPDNVPAHYVQAAAYARLGRYVDARTVLLRAIDREPRDFVTWTLLGDLALRRGDVTEARRDYGFAARLNPRDAQLRGLAGSSAAP